jgi:DNA-directed RNA polymerase specialized sigma24 family protein
MSTEGEGSVTRWIGDLKGGDSDDAARQLWQRYFEQLVRLARVKLRDAPRGPADEEDVALSAFDAFFQGAAAGRFPDLRAREDLWRLLVTITARKASNRRRDEGRQKRGGGRVRAAADRAGADPEAADALDQAVGDAPTPEFAAMVVEECRRLFSSLDDETLRLVALLKLEGYSNEEIATSLDCGLRSVERKLDVIRRRWLAGGRP